MGEKVILEKCGCGSPNCKHVIRLNDLLRYPSLYEENKDYLSTFSKRNFLGKGLFEHEIMDNIAKGVFQYGEGSHSQLSIKTARVDLIKQGFDGQDGVIAWTGIKKGELIGDFAANDFILPKFLKLYNSNSFNNGEEDKLQTVLNPFASNGISQVPSAEAFQFAILAIRQSNAPNAILQGTKIIANKDIGVEEEITIKM